MTHIIFANLKGFRSFNFSNFDCYELFGNPQLRCEADHVYTYFSYGDGIGFGEDCCSSFERQSHFQKGNGAGYGFQCGLSYICGDEYGDGKVKLNLLSFSTNGE
jgi:hypothetical protein